MFCEKCGSPITDGSKFCTECGAPVPAASPAAEPVQPEFPAFPQDDVSEAYSTPSQAAPAAPVQPASAEPEPSMWSSPSQTAPAASVQSASAEAGSSLWSTPSQQTYAAPSWEPAAPKNDFGYSVVGSDDRPSYTPPTAKINGVEITPVRASRPVYKRWWFWLIIVVLVIAVAVAALYRSLAAKGPSVPEPAAPAAADGAAGGLRESAAGFADAVRSRTSVTDTPESPDTPEAPVNEGVEAITNDIDQYLTGEGYLHEIITDEDSITVYLWYEGVDVLTDQAVYAEDPEALGKWAEDIEFMRQLSEDILTSLDNAGLADYMYSIVGILDDIDPDSIIAYAVDGEIIYDWVNDIDKWGLLEN